jgi:uroporphyrinogen decarboxylase
LKHHLGLEEDWRYLSSRAQLAEVQGPILDRFDVDFLPLMPKTAAEPPALDNQRCYVDRWGIERRLPEDGGHYYVSQPPLGAAEMSSDLRAFAWPEPQRDWSNLGAQARELYQATTKALVLNLEVGFLHQTQFLRGFDRWLIDLAGNSAFAQELMDRVLDIWLAEAEAMINATKGCADVVIYADDIAFQDRPMVSPRMYRELLKPRQKRVFDLLAGSGMTVLYHSCGDVWSLLPELVDMGVQALNPIQVSAGRMGNTAELKKEWGNELTFWGGIDTHHILPHGSTQAVHKETWRRFDDLAHDGGYVLAAVHNIQPDTPPANVCALFDAADGWSKWQKRSN